MNAQIDEAKLTTGALSPFLPGTKIQYAWDSTSLGMLKTCPRLYQYVMIDGYGSREESVHLRFGIEYHKTIEEYDKFKAAGLKHTQAMVKSIGHCLIRIWDWDPDTDTPAGNYKNQHTLLSLIIDYMDHYQQDAAKTYIKSNGDAAVELSFRFELDWGPHSASFYPETTEELEEKCKGDPNSTFVRQPYLLCGHLDKAVNFSDELYVKDHKTSKTTIGDYFFDQFSPNNQMTLYSLAGKVVLNTPVRGVIIDAAQIKLTEPNAFKRGMTYRTKEQLDEWVSDLEYWLRQAEAYATAGYWPMNDTACDKFGGCRFRDVCSKSPQVRKIYLKSNFDQLAPEERWNPLKER